MPEMNENLFYIGHIPISYHTKHLRQFFSHYVESSFFKCFHFRHRPEITNNVSEISENADFLENYLSHTKIKKRNVQSLCTFVSLETDQSEEFLKFYKDRHWLHVETEEPMKETCLIIKLNYVNNSVNIGDSQLGQLESYLTRKEQHRIKAKGLTGHSSSNLYHNLIEFNPPTCMPHGNVGTSTMHFFKLIQECKLPSSVIHQLGIEFPSQRGHGLYGAVPFDYSDEEYEDEPADVEEEKEVCSKSGRVLFTSEEYEEHIKNKAADHAWEDEAARRRGFDDSIQNSKSKSREEDDDEECEEWDRFEALHDDPHNLNRNKERIFEERIEQVWEKGGPGVVFYTDEVFWRQQDTLRKDDPFDDPTNLDWDVDMAGYYDPMGNGDRDARDLMDIHRVADLANDEGPVYNPVAHFERHTKGIGSQLMQRQGWRVDQPLGKKRDGLKSALDNEGRKPRDRTGLGYSGERILLPKAGVGMSQRQRKKRRREKEWEETGVKIRTIFDPASDTEEGDTALRRVEPGLVMKYFHKPIRFVYGDTLVPL